MKASHSTSDWAGGDASSNHRLVDGSRGGLSQHAPWKRRKLPLSAFHLGVGRTSGSHQSIDGVETREEMPCVWGEKNKPTLNLSGADAPSPQHTQPWFGCVAFLSYKQGGSQGWELFLPYLSVPMSPGARSRGSTDPRGIKPGGTGQLDKPPQPSGPQFPHP